MATSQLAVTPGTGALIAAHSITEDGNTKLLSRSVPCTSAGAEILPALDATLTSGSQKTQVTSLPALAAGLNRIGRAIIDSLAELEYSLSVNLVPSTLNDGTTYFTMRNNGTNVIRIHHLLALLSFTGTPAATRSLYSLQRFTVATPSGGTAVTPVIRDSANAVASGAVARFAAGGVTTTGVTFETNGVLMLLGHASSAADVVISPPLEHAPLVLRPSEGLAVRANGAMISGSIMTLNLAWREQEP